nr:G protein-coupled receptor [Proales similis]
MRTESVNISLACVYVLILSTSLIGSVTRPCNTLTSVAIIGKCELRQSPPFVLIANVVIAELGLSLTTLPFLLSGLLSAQSPLSVNALLCSLQGTLFAASGTAVSLFLYLIAANRFLLIFKPNVYKKCFTLKSTCTASAFAWLLSFLVTTRQFSGSSLASSVELSPQRLAVQVHSHFEFDHSLLFCRMPQPAVGYKAFISITIVLLPASVTLVIYALLIGRTLRLRSLLQRPSCGASDLRLEAIRFIQFLFLSWLLVFLLGLPMLLIVVFNFDIGPFWSQCCVAFSAFQTAANWLIIVLGNKRLKCSVRDLIKCRANDSIEREQQSNRQRQIDYGIRLLYDDDY